MKETLACFIIDDPLLRPRYGFLEYEKLLAEMKIHRFFTELAFIPWNYKRSDPGTVKLFADNPQYFRLCVHGCDHTDHEFSNGDYQAMSTLSATALWRMEEHKKITGLGYDPVIVFPQGFFSSVALQAARDQGYLASVNCEIKPTDKERPPEIEYRKPFTSSYHDFPLFLRRFPAEKEGLAQDFSSGRPILIVEHHEAFRNGYGTLTEAIDWINSLGNIRWCSLLEIVEHYSGSRPFIIHHDTIPQRSRATVALRRHLCEFRDNYLERNAFLTRAYKLAWTLVKARPY